MRFLIENWQSLLIICSGITVICFAIDAFMKMPKQEQIEKVKEWLLYAVAEAEKELGGGTGQIKLRYVYDKFVSKFPYLAEGIPFIMFSTLVDESLDKFKNILKSNDDLQNYIGG